MPEEYSLVAVSHKKKGTEVRVIANYPTEERARLIESEKKWGGSRGTPHVMPTSEVSAFVKQRATGVYAPTYKAPTPEEQTAAYERKKAQEAFERERETAKLATPKGEVARALLKSKYGITAKPSKEIVMSKEEFKRIKAEESAARAAQTFTKQEYLQSVQERVRTITPKLKFETAEQARVAGYKVEGEIIPTTRTEYVKSFQKRIKEKGGLKGIEIIAPKGLKGVYAIIPKGATVPEFYPEHFKILGTGEMKTGISLAGHKISKSFESLWRKGKLEETYKPEIKMVKKDIRSLQQQMPIWFPGLKEMRREATRERKKLKEKAEKFKTLGEQATGLEKTELKFYEKKARAQAGVYGFAKGFSRAIEQQPEKALAYAGTFYVVPPALAGAGALIKATKITKVASLMSKSSREAMRVSTSYLPGRITPTAKTISKIIPPKVYTLPSAIPKAIVYGGLPAVYGAGVYAEVKYAPEPSVKLGEIFGSEMAPMFIGGAAGIKTVERIKKAYVARKAVGVEFKTATDIAVIESPTGKVARLGPIEYTAKVGGRTYVGVGGGRVDITQIDTKYLTKGIFKYKTQDITVPEHPEVFTSITGTKGVYFQTEYGFKGFSLLATETKVRGRIMPSKAVTVTRGIQVMGGEYPVTVLKTGIFKATYPISPTEARFGITKKIAEKVEPKVYRYEMRYSPEEYGELLVKRGELAGVFGKKLGGKVFGRYYPTGKYKGVGYSHKPLIELDPRLPKTELESIYIGGIKPWFKGSVLYPKIAARKIFKEAFMKGKVGRENVRQYFRALPSLTRERVLRHELIHHIHRETRRSVTGVSGYWSPGEIKARKIETELRGKPFTEIKFKEKQVKTEYFKYAEKGIGAEQYIKQYEQMMQPYSAEAFLKKIEIQRLLKGKKGQVLLETPKLEVKQKGKITEDISGTTIEEFRIGIAEQVRARELARMPKVKMKSLVEVESLSLKRIKKITSILTQQEQLGKEKIKPISEQMIQPITKERMRIQPILDIGIESRFRFRQPVGVIGKQSIAQKQKTRLRPALKQVYKLRDTMVPPPFVPRPPPPPPPPPFIIPFPKIGRTEALKKKRRLALKRKYRGTPSLSNILYGGGTQLTKRQIAGKEYISPLMIRQM